MRLLDQIRALQEELSTHAWLAPAIVSAPSLVAETIAQIYELQEPRAKCNIPVNYRKSKKPRKQLPPRNHRTRKDPFEEAWPLIKSRLEMDPTRTGKSLLLQLIEEDPNKYKINQKRTLQRRVLEWRKSQMRLESEHRTITLDANSSMNIFTDLAILAAAK